MSGETFESFDPTKLTPPSPTRTHALSATSSAVVPTEATDRLKGAVVGMDGVVQAYVDGLNPTALKPGQALDLKTAAQPSEKA